jgi:hypothetical protein
MRATLFSYMWRRGEQCHGADGRPGESCSSRGVVARPVLIQERFRVWRRSGWSSGRRHGPIRGCRQRGARTRHSGSRGDVLSPALQQHRNVVTVLGVARQWRGWPHRVDSDGKDRSRRPDVTAWPCIVTEKAFEGTAGPPSRTWRVSRTGVGGTVSRG